MHAPDPNISQEAPKIRRLDDAAINRIAAGEVVERPASAVKELIENAIDAGASRIEVTVADGGKRLIRVVDDGCGIPAADLPLALSRHATSKIDGSDLLNIHTFGFRGEALASLAAVGRLALTSRLKGKEAAQLDAAGGAVGIVRPAAGKQGTTVELRDLFYATPARLKFLRTERGEMQAVTDVVKRLAMAEPFVSFSLSDQSGDLRRVFSVPGETGDPQAALAGRLRAILGKEFVDNAIAIDAERDDLHLTGYAALPTYSRGSAIHQYFFVNGRPVRDKLLIGALRAAYMDVLSRDRHPAAVLFIDCDPTLVDVNVHPAKSEVRFREPGMARGLIVSGLRHALAEAGHRASSTVGGDTLGAFHASDAPRVYQMDQGHSAFPRGAFEDRSETPEILQGFAEAASARVEEGVDEVCDFPLGAARAQLHENFIVAQTRDGMILVDAHAAHERLVYEKLKAQMSEAGVARQALLVPEIVDIGGVAEALLSEADTLLTLGLAIEPFGPGAIAVRETPAVLGHVDAAALVRDIADELADLGHSTALKSRIDAILSR
ncbi:MAG: DNA mismatch repair endonuclease MutL, partial [Silicimonas sp.]|nr:DNA mismatch repair endonuclease MutL [Silicimonas sp.]